MWPTLIAEGHLGRFVGGPWSSAVTGVVGRPGGLGWGCGHAEQGGDDEDGNGQGGFDPDGP